MWFRTALATAVILSVLNIGVLIGGGNINQYVKGGMLIAVAVAFCTRRVRVVPLVLVIAIILVTALCGVATDFAQFTWVFYFRSLISLIAPFLLLCFEPLEGDRRFFMQLFSWIPAIMVAVGFGYQIIGVHALFVPDPTGGGLRLGGTGAAAFMSASCFLSVLASLEAGRQVNWKYYALAAINLVLLILAGGRMALVMGTVVALISLSVQLKAINLNKLTLINFGLLAMLGAFSILGKNLLARFESGSTSGRELFWTYLDRWISDYRLFGVGLGHQDVIVSDRLRALTGTTAAHNEYIRLQVEIGLVGSIAFWTLATFILLSTWGGRMVRFDIRFLGVCVAYGIYCSTDNALTYPGEFLVLMLAYFAYAKVQDAAPANQIQSFRTSRLPHNQTMSNASQRQSMSR